MLFQRRHSDFIVSNSAASVFQQMGNSVLSLESLGKKMPTPMVLVLQQECRFYNSLCALVRTSLEELRRGLQGDQQYMSPALEALAESLLLREVPQKWLLVGSVAHRRLGSWLRHLVEATEFFREWLLLHEIQSLPPVMHLPAFSDPIRIISAVVQEYARKNHSPMDTITSDSYSIPRQEWNGEPAKNGCYMDGLWIENAYIDDKERTLTECRPNETWSPMSMLLFQAVPKLGIDHKDKLLPLAINRAGCSDLYACPMYRTSARKGESMDSRTSNFITTVQLDPGSRRTEHWVLRGVRIASVVLDTEYS
jgi:dynein heavy chain